MTSDHRVPSLISIVISIGLQIACGHPLSVQFQSGGGDVVNKVRSNLLDSEGHEFSVRWKYSFEGDSLVGQGNLQILGSDYLKLTLPHQKILIQESTVMIWYEETDQVIVDYFDRHDPSNIFSLFLEGFHGFVLRDSELAPDSTVHLSLRSEGLIGFDELAMAIDQKRWVPLNILARLGDNMSVEIKILRQVRLDDPEALKSGTLEGSEVIDLRY